MLTSSDKEELNMSSYTIDEKTQISYQAGPRMKQALCEKYGLQPRDLRALDSGITDLSPSLLVRSNGIVYSSSVVRAVIARDHVVLFESPGLKDSAAPSTEIPRILAEALAPLIASLGQPRMSPVSPRDSYGRAFELRALEALLLLLVRGYSRILSQIRINTDAVITRLQSDVSNNDIKDLADAKSTVEDFVARISSFREMLSSMLREDAQDMSGLYLTARYEGKARTGTDHDEAELMLESVCQRADEVVEAAAALATRVRAADSSLTLVLSSTRNRLIHLELKLELIVLGLTLVNAIFACFGQNLVSGYEQHASAFYIVSASACFSAFVIVRFSLRRLAILRRSSLSRLVKHDD